MALHSVKKLSIFAALLRFVAHLTADSMGPSSLKFLYWLSKRCIYSAIKCVSTIQCHPRSMILVLIESAYGTSCWSVIVTRVL